MAIFMQIDFVIKIEDQTVQISYQTGIQTLKKRLMRNVIDFSSNAKKIWRIIGIYRIQFFIACPIEFFSLFLATRGWSKIWNWNFLFMKGILWYFKAIWVSFSKFQTFWRLFWSFSWIEEEMDWMSGILMWMLRNRDF